MNFWNAFPTVDNQAPDFIIGSFSINSFYLPSMTNELSLSSRPESLATDGTNLIVADTNNHRVLIWNRAPTSPRTPPDVVLGQSDFVGRTANRGGAANGSTLSSPHGVVAINGKLLVSDRDNNRVLIWNSMPTVSATCLSEMRTL